MLLKLSLFVSLVMFGTLGTSLAAATAIGVAKARGSFRIDDATVYRNSTLFDGSAIETENISSELWLASGARLLLASGSRSTVYRDQMVLERGAAQLKGPSNYAIEARTLRIVPAGSDSAARVTLGKTSHIRVEALSGDVQVRNAKGLLVANLTSGTSLELNPAVAALATKLTGQLQQRDGRFILTDVTTNVTVELQGTGLEEMVGRMVEVTGDAIPDATPVAGAEQVIRVSALTEIGAAPPAPGSIATGLSTGAKVAIIGGVAAATSLGGMFATGLFEEEKRPVSP